MIGLNMVSVPCSVDTFRTFIQQYLDGEIEVYIKSEPIPEDDGGPVKVSDNGLSGQRMPAAIQPPLICPSHIVPDLPRGLAF